MIKRLVRGRAKLFEEREKPAFFSLHGLCGKLDRSGGGATTGTLTRKWRGSQTAHKKEHIDICTYPAYPEDIVSNTPTLRGAHENKKTRRGAVKT